MGLDNGIRLKYKGKIEDVPYYVEIETVDYEGDITDEYDVCYWRKCYSLRQGIIDVILENDRTIAKNNEELPFEFDLDQKTLADIRSLIYDTLIICANDEELWDSAFGFGTMISHLARDIVNITWLIEFLDKHTHARAYFYDSY